MKSSLTVYRSYSPCVTLILISSLLRIACIPNQGYFGYGWNPCTSSCRLRVGTSAENKDDVLPVVLRALKKPESPCEVDVSGYVLWHILRGVLILLNRMTRGMDVNGLSLAQNREMNYSNLVRNLAWYFLGSQWEKDQFPLKIFMFGFGIEDVFYHCRIIEHNYSTNVLQHQDRHASA